MKKINIYSIILSESIGRQFTSLFTCCFTHTKNKRCQEVTFEFILETVENRERRHVWPKSHTGKYPSTVDPRDQYRGWVIRNRLLALSLSLTPFRDFITK